MTVFLCVYDKTSYEYSKELFNDISDYINKEKPVIKQNKFFSETPPYFAKRLDSRIERSSYFAVPEEMRITENLSVCEDEGKLKSLENYLKDMDKPFMETLFDYIDKKGLTDVECYKRANIDRKTFNKLKNNPKQRPSKQTAVAFAIALKLDLNETQHLLSTAGLTLSKSFLFDKIIRYFIQAKNYDIYEINQALFEFDQVSLGSF